MVPSNRLLPAYTLPNRLSPHSLRTPTSPHSLLTPNVTFRSQLRNAAMNADRAGLQSAIADAERANLAHEASTGRRMLSRMS